MSPHDVPRWASALARLLREEHRDDIVADLLDERASLVARGRSRAYVSLWLAAHLVRSALVSWPAVAESIGRDARYGIRMLRRSPGFSLVAAGVLALGIGANTAIFSLVNALFFRPLPVRAPTELAFIYPSLSTQGLSCTFDEYLAYKADTSLFTDAAAMNGDVAMFGSAADGTWVSGESVTSNYFELLGVRPRVGRSFTAGDDAPDAAPAIIISDRVWRRRFLADPAILGQAIRLWQPQNTDSGWRYTVVGIMGPEFNGIQSPWTPTEFWTPMLQRSREYDAVYRSILPSFQRSVGLVIGRRQPDVSVEQVQQVVTTRHRSFATNQPSGLVRSASSMDRSLVVLDSRRFFLPLDDQGRIAPSRLASAIAAVAGLVLLIAVTNLIGITIARGVVRRSEIAVRLALGATRQRLARQLVTEGLLLSTAGGLMGVVWSQALVSMFLETLPSTAGSPLEIAFDVPIDLQVLLFTVLVVVGVGIAIGLAPVRQASRTDLVSALANASELAPRRLRSRLRHWIVIPQICVCTGLLLAAGVSTRALLKVALVDPGYRPEGVVTTLISVPFMRSTLPSESAELRQTRNKAYGVRMAELQRRVLEEITALPGTVAAGFASATPLGSIPPYPVVARDEASGRGPEAALNSASVTPGYFAAIGLSLRAGRLFEARDASDVPRIAIVDDATAKRLWPGRPAVGQSLGVHNGNVTRWVWLDVVGVVGNVYAPLSEGEPKPFVYLPAGEPKNELGPLIARGHTTDAELIRNIRATIAQIDPEAIVQRSRPLVEAIEEVRYPRRMAAALLVSSALVGLLLAGVGLYGVVSYSVVQRLKELGIRAALGADRADLTRLVVREAANVTVIGSLIGFGLAVVGIRLVSHQVFAMPGLDWITAAVVPAVLGVVVFAACYLPARRAARVDPLVVLRWQ